MYDKKRLHRARGDLGAACAKGVGIDEARRDYTAARIVHFIHLWTEELSLPLTDDNVASVVAAVRGED